MADRRSRRLDQRRRALELGVVDCWAAYFALGGRATPDQLAAYLDGRAGLAAAEVEVLGAALDELSRPAASDDGERSDGLDGPLAARVDALVARLRAGGQQPQAPPAPAPFRLDEVHVGVRSEPGATFAQPLPDADSPRFGSVLRVDTADQDRWEVHRSGPEVLVLLSGAVEVVLRSADGDGGGQARSTSTLAHPEEALIVPQGSWHRHRATRPGTALLYLTPDTGNVTEPASD